MKSQTFGDLFKNLKTGEAWRLIFASMLRKIKQGMDKKRFRIK